MKLTDAIWQPPTPFCTYLNFSGISLFVQSNSAKVIDNLVDYFADIDQHPSENAIPAKLINQPDFLPEVDFTDWARDPGKTGRKDSIATLEQGVRLLRKVKTGMVFYQSAFELAAIGPAENNPSQIVNFLLSQCMTRLQWNGGLICHAAAVTKNAESVLFAGFSGRGKSTLMLKMLEQSGVAFTSNDRTFIRKGKVHGIAKMPRINPGTVVGNPKLHRLLSPKALATYESMPKQQLWELESKLDVHVPSIYGANKLAWQGQLKALVLLNWQPSSQNGTLITQVDLSDRKDLIPTIAKSPGPFYQTPTGEFLHSPQTPPDEAYIEAFKSVPVYEITGGVNFELAASKVAQMLRWGNS